MPRRQKGNLKINISTIVTIKKDCCWYESAWKSTYVYSDYVFFKEGDSSVQRRILGETAVAHGTHL